MEEKPKKKFGGAQEGSGRPKGTNAIMAEQARTYMLKRIEEELKPIMDAQIDLATGLWYEDNTDGKKRIYKQKPDSQAGKYLLDQSAGKAKDTIDLNTKVTVLFNE